MKRTTALSAIGLLMLGSFTAAAQRADTPKEWKRHAFPEDRFEIELAGQFATSAVKLDSATQKKIKRSMQYLHSDGDRLFVVGAQENIEAVNFDGGSRSSFAALNCKQQLPETDVPIDGGRGRELKGSECIDGQMRVEARYFEHGKWFYQVIAIFAADSNDEVIARRFLNSFKILAK